MATALHSRPNSNSALLRVSSSSPLHDAFDRTPSLSNSDETTTSDSDYFINFTDSLPPTLISFGNFSPNANASSNALPDKPLPITPRQRQKSKAPARREKSVSSVIASRIPFTSVLCDQRILRRFLTHAAWQDFHALLFVSRELQQNLWRPDLKDILFSRFIPGYSKALRIKDSRFWVDNIRLTPREFVLYSALFQFSILFGVNFNICFSDIFGCAITSVPPACALRIVK